MEKMNSDPSTDRRFTADKVTDTVHIDPPTIEAETKIARDLSTDAETKRKSSDSGLGEAKKKMKLEEKPISSSKADHDKRNRDDAKTTNYSSDADSGRSVLSSDLVDYVDSDGNVVERDPGIIDYVDDIYGDSDAEDKSGAEAESVPDGKIPDEIVSKYLALGALPSKVDPLKCLTNAEKRELENCFQIDKHGWREDWIGNLAFADQDIANPDGKSRAKGKKALFRWAEKGKLSRKLLNNLLRIVYNLKETPQQAKNVLASADPKSVHDIQDAVRRVSYDPIVLRQDGWTTAKSSAPIGASGGPYRIGEMVFWQGYTGVVIAYLHDDHLGDLWKAMWLKEFDTFDLEAEELDDAKRRHDRRNKLKEQKEAPKQAQTENEGARRSGRSSSADFTVKGIEHGIVLGVSYSRGSRPGVFWPARVMHFSEMRSQARRGSQKQKVDVVFLAPYWNATPSSSSGRKESYSESLSRHGSSIFSSGPLFELETIDASYESIQEYPYSGNGGLDIDQLRTSFKFVGLPKAAFPRYVDAHRLALGLRTHSQNVMKSTVNSDDLHLTTAGLFEAHPIAAQTAHFPEAILHLPFHHILSQLPGTDSEDSSNPFDDSESNEEPVLRFGAMLDSMKPPNCWGLGEDVNRTTETPQGATMTAIFFRSSKISLNIDASGDVPSVSLDQFTSGLTSFNSLLSENDKESSMCALLVQNLSQLLGKIPIDSSEFQSLSLDVKRDRCKALIKLWIAVKVRVRRV
jgi:hypothetical protein